MRDPDESELMSDEGGSVLKPFLQHLEELRWTLIKMIVTLGVTMLLSFLFAPQLLGVFMWPLRRIGVEPAAFLRTQEVTGGFTLAMTLALYAGFVIASPLLMYFLTQFILPALTVREKRLVSPVVLGGVGLFLAGAALAYFVVIPQALQFFLSFNERLGIRSDWLIDDYVSFVARMLLAFGVCFEMPLVVLVLAKLGILTREFMRQKRPHVIVLILIVAAVITPTTDPINMALLAVPMTLLYEACIWIVWWMERKKA